MAKRSKTKLVSTLLAATLILAACGGSSSAPSDNSSNGNTGNAPGGTQTTQQQSGSTQPVKIEFWFSVGGNARKWIEEASQRFNSEQNEVQVDAIYQGDYYTNHQKVATAISAGAAPAMTMIEVASIPFFADNGVLADINTLASPEDLARYLPGLMKETQWDGQTISIPFNRSVPILYLNKTILEQEGLDPEGPKTWEELRQYAEKLVKRAPDGTVERWGFLTPVDQWFFEAMLYQAGGRVYSDDGKKVVVNEEPGQQALQFWVDLIDDGLMEMPQGEKYNAWDVTTNALTTGKAAMIYSTTGRLKSHVNGGAENGYEITTAFLPAGPKGYATPTGGANLAILNVVPREQQEAAWKFLKWLTSDENAASFAQATGYIPITQGAVDMMADYFKEFPQARTAVDFLQYAQSRPQAPSYNEAQEILVKYLQKAVLKEATVKQALDDAAALMQSAM